MQRKGRKRKGDGKIREEKGKGKEREEKNSPNLLPQEKIFLVTLNRNKLCSYTQKSFSLWGTSSPRPHTGALSLDPRLPHVTPLT